MGPAKDINWLHGSNPLTKAPHEFLAAWSILMCCKMSRLCMAILFDEYLTLEMRFFMASTGSPSV